IETEAPFKVSVEAMMTERPGFACSIFGKAVMPSITGISMSSTATSISLPGRVSASTASWPLPTVVTTLIAGSLSRARVSRPRITAESSTTITRYGPAADAPDVLAEAPDAALNAVISCNRCDSGQRVPDLAIRAPSQQSDLGEFGFDDFAVEGLH